MSSISNIRQRRDDFFNGINQNITPGREVFLKDGDQVFLTSVATGAEDEAEKYLDDFSLYTFRSNNRWTNILQDDSVDQSSVPDDVRASRKFAFWAYVHEIMHEEKRNEEWETVEHRGGKKMFKETVDDFRIITLGFGRGSYVFGQLEEVFLDWGSLNKGVIRVKRTGSGALDTSYTIAATTRALSIPKDRLGEIAELDTIMDYMKGRYGGATTETSESSTNSTEGGLGDLF